MKDRVVFFIDGFNVYHALAGERCGKYQRYKWLDYRALAQCFISPKKEELKKVLYFTAYAHWNQQKMARHKQYVKALRFQEVQIVLGKFKKVTRNCLGTCKEQFQTFEEKETDVNIAIHLLKLAFLDTYDTAVILSGDSDLIPAIEAVKSVFPHKTIRVVIPIARSAESMKKVCDGHHKMKEKHLRSSQLPDPLVIDAAKRIFLRKPREWA